MTDWTDDLPSGGAMYGWVWQCGDECGCSQAQIRHRADTDPGGTMGVVVLWRGPFHTGGDEDIPSPAAVTELNREAQRLRRHHHDVYKRIEWPWTRSDRERRKHPQP